jgi:hypothetical protein
LTCCSPIVCVCVGTTLDSDSPCCPAISALDSSAVRSQLHRNFGKLYSAQGRLDDALK